MVQNSDVLIGVARRMMLTKRKKMDRKYREPVLLQMGVGPVDHALPANFLG